MFDVLASATGTVCSLELGMIRLSESLGFLSLWSELGNNKAADNLSSKSPFLSACSWLLIESLSFTSCWLDRRLLPSFVWERSGSVTFNGLDSSWRFVNRFSTMYEVKLVQRLVIQDPKKCVYSFIETNVFSNLSNSSSVCLHQFHVHE